MNREWSRAYPPGAGRWGVIAWEAGGLAYLHWTTARLFDLPDAAAWALAAAFLLVWLLGSWRVVRMGPYVSGDALLLRGVFRSRTIPWTDIEDAAAEEITHRLGAFRVPAGRAVVLTLRSGERVTTSVWEKGLDLHRRPDLFGQVCRELRARVLAARVPARPPAR